MIADNTMRSRAATFGPELLYWLRCLVEGLHGRRDTTVIRPRPKVVEEATAAELEVIFNKTASRQGNVREKVQEFVGKLVVCARGVAPNGTREVQKALVDFAGVEKKDAPQLLVDAGLKTRTVCVKRVNVWAYVNADGKALRLPQ